MREFIRGKINLFDIFSKISLKLPNIFTSCNKFPSFRTQNLKVNSFHFILFSQTTLKMLFHFSNGRHCQENHFLWNFQKFHAILYISDPVSGKYNFHTLYRFCFSPNSNVRMAFPHVLFILYSQQIPKQKSLFFLWEKRPPFQKKFTSSEKTLKFDLSFCKMILILYWICLIPNSNVRMPSSFFPFSSFCILNRSHDVNHFYKRDHISEEIHFLQTLDTSFCKMIFTLCLEFASFLTQMLKCHLLNFILHSQNVNPIFSLLKGNTPQKTFTSFQTYLLLSLYMLNKSQMQNHYPNEKIVRRNSFLLNLKI